ncbi:GNAT family N-acetyltransferase [bacterium]|nr:GNAT family N-acetyltransferase [bacterium]
MLETLSQLTDHLAAWASRPEDSDQRTSLASAVLDAAADTLDDVDDPVTDQQRDMLIQFLEDTSRPDYLEALPDDDARHRWSDVALSAVERSGYTLETMLNARVREIPSQTYFEELKPGDSIRWSYAQVQRRVQAITAVFLRDSGDSIPRVALQVDNSLDGACCDLACMLHDILVAPLNVHFDAEELAWIIERLDINAVVVDREDRLRRMHEVRKLTGKQFRIYAINLDRDRVEGRAISLAESVARLSTDDVRKLLERRPRFGLHDICTVMFTSGSTGRPKGVAFTQFNLVSKRFARHAALPSVGRDEVLLCYLPLFHTFGRYLEMLGMLYWRGKYIFVGNPSTEALLAAIKRTRPTGLISIPLRWTQIRERALNRMEQLTTSDAKLEAFQDITGGRLRWGLSAAGYLEPKAFRFFQTYGVDLCSGFGMTEATGGITMSPPGDYQDNTVGKPLPAMKIKLAKSGEMLIGGAYVARYLKEDGEGLEVEPGQVEEDGVEYLPTGDIFKKLKRGHLSIVDRIKDIYKNNRGQTVAPQRVERKFATVPGIKRTFLVGDHRSYNVLLIVPDLDDPVLTEAPDEESRRDYFRQIVTAANQDLAPYERVVNYTLLDRNFDADHDELTPKGTYKRKVIEKNFEEVIASLYESSHVDLEAAGVKVRIPRWIFRDLGILESDIAARVSREEECDQGCLMLVDNVHRRSLQIRQDEQDEFIIIGDLSYNIRDGVLDLGLFARQPRLWMANPALMRFAPCREGWDVPFHKQVAPHAMLPKNEEYRSVELVQPVEPLHLSDSQLQELNLDLQVALFGTVDNALKTLEKLRESLISYDDRLGGVARLRLTALATHPDERVRCTAYRILLLDEPMLDYSVSFPAFVQSGLSFLNEESIKYISREGFGKRRLAALRQRLYAYRLHLKWPADPMVQRQFKNVFRLLVNFVRFNAEYYKTVRAELASWLLHRVDPQIARFAEMMLDHMVSWFEGRLVENAASVPETLLEEMLVYDEDMDALSRDNIQDLLLYTTFLKQSVMLTFHEEDFDIDQVPAGGIWVSRVQASGTFSFYRVSVNTIAGKHFDLLLIQRQDMNARAVMDTNHWMIAIGGHPYGQRVLPRFGCIRPELATMSLEYVNELTAWEKIREYAGSAYPNNPAIHDADWRRLYVTAMATFFRAWKYSGKRIIPGVLAPTNVVVPELDFREEALILSLSGWDDYTTPRSLIRPLWANFFRKTLALYPMSAKVLDDEWLFDAAIEGLGATEGEAFLREFAAELDAREVHSFPVTFVQALDDYIDALNKQWYVPQPLRNAIHRYHTWEQLNPNVTAQARAELLEGLIGMYHLARAGELARYHLYRYTFFEHANETVKDAYDLLLQQLWAEPELHATQRVELSELQAVLETQDDREVFSRLVFPRAHRSVNVEVMTYGEKGRRQVVVRTGLEDNHGEHYDIREPIEPEEVGSLYRLFYQERFPKSVSEQDRHIVVTDATGRVIAGLTFKDQEKDVVHMDGLVTSGPLMGRGIATALLEDFVTRMASRGVKVLKTDFLMRDFCERRGFTINKNWGGLVRFISQEEPELDRGDIPRDD